MNEIQKYNSQVPSVFKAGHGYLVAAALTAGLALQCLGPDFASRCQDLMEYVSNAPSISSNKQISRYNEENRNTKPQSEEAKREVYKPEKIEGFGNMCDIQNGRIVRFKIRDLPDKFY